MSRLQVGISQKCLAHEAHEHCPSNCSNITLNDHQVAIDAKKCPNLKKIESKVRKEQKQNKCHLLSRKCLSTNSKFRFALKFKRLRRMRKRHFLVNSSFASLFTLIVGIQLNVSLEFDSFSFYPFDGARFILSLDWNFKEMLQQQSLSLAQIR